MALVTPMLPGGEIDNAALAGLIDFHCNNGTDAIVSVGTTGESATLDMDEHIEVIRRTVQWVNGRIPVIAGTGANSTSEAVELTLGAKNAGADACLLVTPYYNKPTQEGLYRHFKHIAESVSIPQILYNVPGRTAVDMKPETVERLSKIENIIGIKEALGELERVREILRRCGKTFKVYSGDDYTAMESMLLGAAGTISVTANVAPQAMHDMCFAAIEGNREKAEQINQILNGLHRDLFIESNPIPVKWALMEMGLVKSGIRLPLTELSTEHRPRLKDALRQANVI